MGGTSLSAPPATITGTDPAAGQNVSQAVPAGKVWDVKAIELRLVANATVANRNVDIFYEDATGVEIARNVFSTSITASQTVKIHIGTYETLPTNTATDHYHKIPRELLLTEGFIIKTVTAGLQAGDNFDAPKIIAREYLVPQN